MYLFLTKVRSFKGNEKYPEGERHAALVFSFASNMEDGEKMAITHLGETYWGEVTIERKKTVSADSLKKADSTIREAYESALENGTSGIIYSDPID